MTKKQPLIQTNNLSIWRRLSLFSQIVLVVTLLIFVIVFSISYLTIQGQRQSNASDIRRNVISRLTTLEAASLDALFLSDVDTLDGLGDRMEDSEDVIAVVFFDATGRVIAVSGDHPLRAYEGMLDSAPQGLELVAQEDISFVESDDVASAGTPVRVGRHTIGAILIEVSTLEFTRSLQVIQRQSILISLAALLSGIFVSLLISRLLVRPLQNLAQATNEIAGGDFDHKITFRPTSAETGQLIASLEFMRSELKQLYSGLEEQVEARTTELAKTNTSLVQTNKKLEIAQQQAHEASRLKSEFLATMSHELRTPLNAILGYCGLLLMGVYGELNEDIVMRVRMMEDSGNHLLALINDILDISKIEAGRMKLISTPFLVYDMKQKLVSRISILANNKGLAFTHSLDPDLPDAIISDPERLTQVVSNLLSNAVKFTDEGEVNLMFKRHDEDRRKWQIIVSDTGIGIPADALEYIFDEFRQVDGSYTRVYQGTGLGLAITQKLVHAMSGIIEVESEPGKGSKFTVTLPLITEIKIPAESEINDESD